MSPERAIHELSCAIYGTIPFMDGLIEDDPKWERAVSIRNSLRDVLKRTRHFSEHSTAAQVKGWEAERFREVGWSTSRG